MKSIHFYPLLLAGILILCHSAIGQQSKYGKYQASEWELTEVPFDPDADAVVLDEENISFISNYVLLSEINRRFKVLKESGKSIGDVVIRYYAKDQIESIQKLRAQIVQLENGQEKVTKLGKDDYFEVDAGNGWREIRFTFPNVQTGSILEYSYTKRDKSIVFIDGWVFQNHIPTLRSTYHLEIPGELEYRMLGQGFNVITSNYRKEKGSYQWNLTNLPSIKEEPYMNNPGDYLEKVQFQLAKHEAQSQSMGIVQSNSTSYFRDWQDLGNWFMNEKSFATYLKPDRNTQRSLVQEPASERSPLDLIQKIYQHVTDNFTFNEKPGVFPSQTLKTTLDLRTGKRSDINLALLAYLRANGIEAFPLLISSKGNGRSHLVHAPFADQFNQLILAINTGEKLIYADATQKDHPLGYLSLPSLVHEAFILRDPGSGLIDIQVPHLSGFNQFVNVKWDEAGYFKKESSFRFSDYDALAMGGLKTDAEKAEFRKKIVTVEDDQVLSIKSELTSKLNKLTHESTLSTKLFAPETAPFHVLPFSITRWKENPFTSDTRNFPVDFNYTVTDRFSFKMDIPEGYELDDFPENINLTIPDGTMLFSYVVTALEAIVQVNMVLQIKQEYVDAEQYPHLKYFMDVVTSKLKEPVILRKTDLQATASNHP
ncbi:MAG: DUF3857 and transglutaminase domain-containing protein [Lunatimonas sp.]|uniref:DUF3857 and transglutaminase domain-containing protein n=1 Tax=Lunatimonas sp. TaxID=2060141 RepID=UPI00263B458E|nr:DUF3857 and transglutaminase domain-containing protein [Lunatimonas sp.]MCC5939156.1 DUF3857 and transglutaminase domain-containing protein [Lunatimonas sp.]